VDLGLRNRIAVVTGGSSGIGFTAARLLLDDGARVAICGRDAERLATVKKRLDAGSSAVLAAPCDVLEVRRIEAFTQEVNASSRGRVDILVNNAGQGRVSTFTDTSDAQWCEELNLKFFSQIRPVRAFRHLLDASDAPAIVAVNSLLSLQPEPHMVCTLAARAGVQNLLKSLAAEFAPRIRVNTVPLGLVDSGQWRRRFEGRDNKRQSREDWFAALAKDSHIPLGRLGRPDEAARAIVFLGSPAASVSRFI
jgi:NAD(P)-dependent dehydrogenase (short-subunit alcohol dehydrogenase family)